MKEKEYDFITEEASLPVFCCHLDDDGIRCRETSTIKCSVHEEFGGFWHISYFCEKHANLRGKSLEEINYN